jgi:hypothetical protein
LRNLRDWERPWAPSTSWKRKPILKYLEAWREQESANEMFPQDDFTFYCSKCHTRVNFYMEKPGKCLRCRRSKHMKITTNPIVALDKDKILNRKQEIDK